MGKNKALIFGAAPCGEWRFLEPLKNWPDLIIAADGGLNSAEAAGFSVSAYIGDNDSGGTAPGNIPSRILPSEKDLTDLEAAYIWALEQGCRQVCFTGCTGGRLDHELSALGLLERASEEMEEAMIVDPGNRIRLVRPGKTITIRKSRYRYFSLVPLDRTLSGITIRGAKYTCENLGTVRTKSLTISNEFLEDQPVEITLDSGSAYLVEAN